MLTIILSIVVAVAVAWALAYHRANGVAWTLALAAGAAALPALGAVPAGVLAAAWAFVAVFGALAIVKPLRRAVLSGPLFGVFRKVLPPMSDTEREALEAGSVWWDADLFTGRPDWKKLLAYPAAKLTAEE
ncbi:MAG TPA: acyl-CoA dehydrogenase, partial [Usitatibacteraceae bacterium]|nr:acyl-CoA dehydrogenase [Usitatibacteraceae bacterium]